MHFTLFEATASGRRRGCSENIRRYSPTRTSQTRARKHARPDTHTPTRAPWQIITPTASGEQNAHVGPITALDKGHGTLKTLLLCLSPKPCVCFAWLSEPDLRIFTAIWSPCIPAGLKNVKSSDGAALKMQYAKGFISQVQPSSDLSRRENHVSLFSSIVKKAHAHTKTFIIK